MRWDEVNVQHDGRKVKVWADSSPEYPEGGEPPTVGYISCPAKDIVPVLKVGMKETHTFAGYYQVEFV